MTTSIRKHPFHALTGAGLALALWLGPGAATAAAADDTGCHQEVRRVVVWPPGPKAQSRVESREVTVCNGKVVSQKAQRHTSKPAQPAR